MEDQEIKVLIVEDTRSTALVLSRVLAPFTVVGVAQNGDEALRLMKRLDPHVITMDIHLPDMNGLELTRKILAERTVPIVVVSGLVSAENQDLVFEALRAGAYEVVPKSKLLSATGRTETQKKLVQIVRAAANRAVRGEQKAAPRGRRPLAVPAIEGGLNRVVAIGASTGGPAALRSIFTSLSQEFKLPILVAQHIADGFMEGFVQWLNSQTPLDVRITRRGETPKAGCAYFPPRGHHLILASNGQLDLVPRESEQGACPSVDVLFRSVAKHAGRGSVCLLMTGMGMDGAQGLLEAKEKNAVTAVQDEESSVVFGMPQQALRLGATETVLPLEEIAAWLTQVTGSPAGATS